MLNSMFFLQFHGFSGGGFRDVLVGLENLVFFSYLLPFLIIFALVFGILTKIKIFEDNKSINAIIALSVGLMALQFGNVSLFFSEIFPRLGIGLSIILVMMVLLGLFAPNRSWMTYILFLVSAIIFITIIVKSSQLSEFYFGGGYFWDVYGSLIIAGIVLLIFIAVIVGSANPNPEQDISSNFMNALFPNRSP